MRELCNRGRKRQRNTLTAEQLSEGREGFTGRKERELGPALRVQRCCGEDAGYEGEHEHAIGDGTQARPLPPALGWGDDGKCWWSATLGGIHCPSPLRLLNGHTGSFGPTPPAKAWEKVSQRSSVSMRP